MTSFESLKNWYQTCEDIIETPHIYAVVGNKNDKFEDQKVTEKQADEFAKEIKSPFRVVSAKTTPQLFIDLLEELTKTYKNNNLKKRRKSVKLVNSKNTTTNRKCLCDSN